MLPDVCICIFLQDDQCYLFSMVIHNSSKIHYQTKELVIYILPNAAHASSF